MASASSSSAEGSSQHEVFIKEEQEDSFPEVEEVVCVPELVLVKEEKNIEESKPSFNQEAWFCNEPETVEDVKDLTRTAAGASDGSSVSSKKQTASSVLGGERDSSVTEQGDIRDGWTGLNDNESDRGNNHFKYSSDRGDLDVHLPTHERVDKLFACHHCNYTTAKKGNFNRHLRTHESVVDKPFARNSDQLFACHLCNYTSNQKGHLKRHFITHETVRVKPFACNHCSYSTDRKECLQTHLRVHESVRNKPFACKHCNYSTDNKSHLKMHFNIHKSVREKPFACTKCNYSTDIKTHLKHHLNTHEIVRIKPFACSHCNYTTDQKSNLGTHLKTHKIV